MTLLREIGRLALAFVVAGLMVTALAFLFVHLGLEEPERSARKALVPFYLIAWWWLVRVPRAELPAFLALVPRKGAWRSIFTGYAVGAATLVVLNGVFLLIGARRIEIDDTVWKVFLAYPFMALIGATLEGILFRGVLHRRLLDAAGAKVAIGLGSVIYSITHFLRPPSGDPPRDWWDAMLVCCRGVATIWEDGRWREAFGLTLVGLVLSLLRHRQGIIYLSIGVHAGWIFVQHTHRKTLAKVEEVVGPGEWWLGTQDNYDGLLGWIALVISLIVVVRITSKPETTS